MDRLLQSLETCRCLSLEKTMASPPGLSLASQSMFLYFNLMGGNPTCVVKAFT